MPVALTGLMLSADRSAQNVFPCLNRFKKGAISTEGCRLLVGMCCWNVAVNAAVIPL